MQLPPCRPLTKHRPMPPLITRRGLEKSSSRLHAATETFFHPFTRPQCVLLLQPCEIPDMIHAVPFCFSNLMQNHRPVLQLFLLDVGHLIIRSPIHCAFHKYRWTQRCTALRSLRGTQDRDDALSIHRHQLLGLFPPRHRHSRCCTLQQLAPLLARLGVLLHRNS